MSKELILLTDVDGLGIVGDVVKVADGFARNYLLPHKKAAPVTQKARERLAEARVRREAELLEERNHANVLAAQLENATITIKVKTSGEGRLYGSVGPHEIFQAAKDAKLPVTDAKQVSLGAHIRQLGHYDVRIRLHRDIAVKLGVDVVPEAGE